MSHLRGKVITALTMLGCPAVSHRHVSSSKPHVLRAETLHVTDAGTQSAPQSQSGHVVTAHARSLHSLCTHLTWNKVDDTTLSRPVLRQKSHCEPHSSTHWWDRLTLQHTEGEVWVWQPATIISSCHYLPSHSQLRSQRQMHKHCAQVNMHKHTHKRKHTGNTRQEHTGLS